MFVVRSMCVIRPWQSGRGRNTSKEVHMPRLTDTQLVVLSAAAAREDHSVLPLPKSLKGGAVTKVLNALITRGLIEQAEDPRFAVEDGFRITRAGLRAINADDTESTQAACVAGEKETGATPPETKDYANTAPDSATQGQEHGKPTVKLRQGTKQALMIALLEREEGATIAQLQEATGWRVHTCRGAMSGVLKKKLGLVITSEKNGAGERIYHIAS